MKINNTMLVLRTHIIFFIFIRDTFILFMSFGKVSYCTVQQLCALYMAKNFVNKKVFFLLF